MRSRVGALASRFTSSGRITFAVIAVVVLVMVWVEFMGGPFSRFQCPSNLQVVLEG